jgi:hypothetical protein
MRSSIRQKKTVYIQVKTQALSLDAVVEIDIDLKLWLSCSNGPTLAAARAAGGEEIEERSLRGETNSTVIIRRHFRHQERKLSRHIHPHEEFLSEIRIAICVGEDHIDDVARAA